MRACTPRPDAVSLTGVRLSPGVLLLGWGEWAQGPDSCSVLSI